MKKIYKSPWLRYRSLCALAITILLYLSSFQNLNAQVSGYTFSQSNGTYTPITGGTVLATATGSSYANSIDNYVYPITLPFSFTFNQQSYTALNVSSNGFITFGATAPSTSLYSPISSTAAFEGVISAFAGDLNSVFDIAGVTGDLRWEEIGTAPNREIVIQWKDFRPSPTTSTTNVYTFSFQIRLHETSNNISVVYNSGSYLAGSTSISSTRQIGLRGTAATDFNNRLNDATVAFDASTAGTSNSSAQAFNTTANPPGMPSAGLVYTWVPPSCLGPTGINVGTPTQTDIPLSWNAATTTVDGYDVYYSTVNTAPTSSTVLDASNSITTTSNSGTITGLTSSTVYYIWIRTVCSSTDKSAWVQVPATATLCAAVTAPYTYDVEAAAETVNSTIGNCWSSTPSGTSSAFRWNVDGSGSTPSSDTGPSGAYSGVKYFYAEATDGSSGAVAELYTPPIDVTALTNPSVQFYYHMYGAAMGELHVDVYDGAAWTNDVFVLTGQQHTSATAAWTQAIVDLSALTITGNIQVRFRGIKGTDYTGDMSLDDIAIVELPSCFPLTNPQLDSFTANSATLSWTPPTTAPSGYQFYYDTTNTPPTAATAPNGGSSVTSPGTVSGLSADTTYYIWVRSDCGTSQAAWVGPVTVYTGYCTPAPSSVDNDGITNVTFGNAPNVVNNTTATETGNYGNYSAMIGDISAGVPTAVDVTYTTGYSYGTKIWVDLDNNLSFDASELLFTGLVPAGGDGTTPLPSTINASITIPAATALGNYRMRIGGTDNDAGPSSPCYTGTYGSFEDYTINVTAAPSCLPPTGLDSTETTTDATVTWVAPTPAPVSYDVYVDTTNTQPATATYTGVTGTSQVIPGTSGTTYYVWVASNCGTSTSVAAGPVSYTIPFPPPANDDCSGAIVLIVNPDYACGAITSGTTVSATASTETAPSCGTSGTNDDVWFKFTATNTSHRVALSNVSGTTDMGMAVYSGTCGGLVQVLCSDPNTMDLTGLTVGTEYTVRVWTWTSTATTTASFDICVGTPPPPPANDECSGAIALTPGTTYNSNITDGTNTSATTSSQADPTTCNGYAGGDVWYTVTMPATGTLTIETGDMSTGASGIDTVITVYTGTDCSNLTQIGCDDDGAATGSYSMLTVNEPAGTALYIRVYEYSNDNDGDFGISAYAANLGTNEIVKNDKEFSFYPNPFDDVIYIKDAREVKSIQVMDAAGRLVKTISDPGTEIRMGDLQKGMYIFVIEMKDGSKSSVKAIKK